MTLYLSRLRLSSTPSAKALDALINPDDPGRRLDAHHRLLWAAFSDDADRRRDFLWRSGKAGEFMTLSARPPRGGDLFDEPDVKEFAPQLARGDRLAFTLRANATRTVKAVELAPNGKAKRKHQDLVMHRLKPVSGDERAAQRPALALDVAREWLAWQGARSGFVLATRHPRDGQVEPDLDLDDYSVVALPGHRGARSKQPQFGILDMTGHLEVTDPAAFVGRLVQGFGRAKAYGCGLMLIRRAG